MTNGVAMSAVREPRWFGLTRVPLFPRCIIVGASLAVLGGAVWGFVRGLSYLPTLPAAIVEGAIIIGVPGAVIATVLAAFITGIVRLRRRYNASGACGTARAD